MHVNITPEACAQVLKTMGCDRVTETELLGIAVYVSCDDGGDITLDGDFSPLALAAVLGWNQDRKAVAAAWDLIQ